MSPRQFQEASEISTNHRCSSCGIMMDQVKWVRCQLCKIFHLCRICESKFVFEKHQQHHPDMKITKDVFQSVSIHTIEDEEKPSASATREMEYERILRDGRITNDYEMFVVMNTLIEHSPLADNPINSLIVKYHLKANERKINILSLDGGGVRGYMPIKILTELITQKYLPNMTNFDVNNVDHRDQFHQVQSKFTKNFDYFVGTSTGGLIAFCLAIGYNILDLTKIYSESKRYFKRNYLGPLLCSKYDPSVIHKKIDDIINQITFPGNKKITAENATLLDIRNLLNPDRVITAEQSQSVAHQYGYLLEFVDPSDHNILNNFHSALRDPHRIEREKVLLITAYNTTKNCITVFNTSYADHWGYRIADVLKSTMAAPTYFPPQKVHHGVQNDGHFFPSPTAEMFIDGGVFANDPELAAIWVIRMQWKKPTNYNLLSIGTGTYTNSLSTMIGGGYVEWIFNNGILVNTLMDATRSFTEVIAANLAKFNNMRRMKLNYNITKPMDLDDPNFVNVFDEEWNYLRNGDDFNAFLHFYNNRISCDM